jgi:hypothetical protein
LILCGLGWSTEVDGTPHLIERLQESFIAASPCTCVPACAPTSSYRIECEPGGETFRLEAIDDQRRGTWESIVEGFFDLAERDFAMNSSMAVVHAGLVAIDGKALVIPGRSRAGKSSLVVALAQCGAEYMSDEYAIFRGDGLVEGFRRPPRLRSDVQRQTVSLGRQQEMIPVGVVVATSYDPATTTGPHLGTAAEGLMALLDNAVMIRERPELVTRSLGRAVRDAEVLIGPRGEARILAEQLLGRARQDRPGA